MAAPTNEWKRDWVGLAGLLFTVICAVCGTLLAGVLYLANRLSQIDSGQHVIDIRLTRIETKLGVEDPPQHIATR